MPGYGGSPNPLFQVAWDFSPNPRLRSALRCPWGILELGIPSVPGPHPFTCQHLDEASP